MPLYIRERATSGATQDDFSKEIQEGVHPKGIESQLLRGDKHSFLIEESLQDHFYIALLGHPGTGKTTLLKQLCLDHCLCESSRFPVLITIKELLATDQTIAGTAQRKIERYCQAGGADAIWHNVCSKGRLLLCIDGLDELDIDDPDKARKVLRAIGIELADIVGSNSNNVAIVSSRSESWPTCRPEMPNCFVEYEIQPLPVVSIREFVLKWFRGAASTLATALLDQFRLCGWPEFSSNPLLLALACIVYEKRGSLPTRQSALYQKCIDVLLEEWDATRRVGRREAVHTLTPEKKVDILCEIALSFHSRGRACFGRAEVVNELSEQLPKVGIDPCEAFGVLEDISAQHGLLRTWSIENLYAFPHLCFQEYLAARALRDRSDGLSYILEKMYDPFWRGAIIAYADTGDVAGLIGGILNTESNVLRSHIFLASDCLSTGAQLSENTLSYRLTSELRVLIESDVEYLSEKAIDALAHVDTNEAHTVLEELIKDKDGKLVECYAAKYAVKLFGEGVADELVRRIVGDDYCNENMIESLRWLPEDLAIEKLQYLIATNDYEGGNEKQKDRGIRFRRQRAAMLLAEVGRERAISPLLSMMYATRITNFEKWICIDALASISHPSVSNELRRLCHSFELPDTVRIRAAQYLEPGDVVTKTYLLSVIGDAGMDSFVRRDAAYAVKRFVLCEDELVPLEKLAADIEADYWGGPAYAVDSIASIGGRSGRDCLARLLAAWKNAHAINTEQLISRIEIALARLDPESDRGRLVMDYLRSDGLHSLDWDFPDLLAEFYHQAPARASAFVLDSISRYSDGICYGRHVVSAALSLLPSIPLSPDLVRATVNLALRMPRDFRAWDTLDLLWKRRDLDAHCRREFYKDWSCLPKSQVIT